MFIFIFISVFVCISLVSTSFERGLVSLSCIDSTILSVLSYTFNCVYGLNSPELSLLLLLIILSWLFIIMWLIVLLICYCVYPLCLIFLLWLMLLISPFFLVVTASYVFFDVIKFSCVVSIRTSAVFDGLSVVYVLTNFTD